MYSRLLRPPSRKSFFLFGPRGTGKTHWLKANFPKALYIDLLEAGTYIDLQARPGRLAEMIPPRCKDWILLDEVQRIPELLNEVHRLIEHKNYKFILTGSSARSLRKKGVNLLAGRALVCRMYPLTCVELGKDFSLEHALNYGQLPATFAEKSPQKYLEAYVLTYLREEVLQEGLTRNLGAFIRFLETASFSQGGMINMSEIAREAMVERKVVESYFDILEDLLLARQLHAFIPKKTENLGLDCVGFPTLFSSCTRAVSSNTVPRAGQKNRGASLSNSQVFSSLGYTKRAKRRLVSHPKFYYFDAGVFRTLRPMGALDRPEEAERAALETLVYQELCAITDYFDCNYKVFYWRTSTQIEVDFVLYGPRGILAIEVKRTKALKKNDLAGLRAFAEDYPEAKLFLFYMGQRREYHDGIQAIPIAEALQSLPAMLSQQRVQ